MDGRSDDNVVQLQGAAANNRVIGERRRAEFLRILVACGSLEAATRASGIAPGTVEKWRTRYPDFAQAILRALTDHRPPPQAGGEDPDAQLPVIDFRQRYFGHETTWFQLDMIHRIENAKPGSFLLFLLPPEHGKTTVLEETLACKLTYDRTFRALVATSDDKKAEKRIQRIQRIFSEDGPCPDLYNDHGPFKPEIKAEAGYQPWTKSFFNLRGKEASDERDYNVEAVGITRAISGARCDWLIFDDIQDLRSLNQTDRLIEVIRQDWLTRPGSRGIVIAIGTRVGPDDIYQRFQDEGLVTEVVQYPAVIENYDLWHAPADKTEASMPPPGVKFLWPERYTPADYLVMRKNAGEIGWERNYMQRGADARSQPFSREMVLANADPLRSVTMRPEDFAKMRPDSRNLVIALDPGFGVNAILVAALNGFGMEVLDGRIDTGLQNNAQIAAVLRETCEKWAVGGLNFTHLIIEDKAFQRGLLRDDEIRTLASIFGFQIVPYSTGSEKNDPNIGVPSLAAAFEQGRIVIPNASDPATTLFLNKYLSQFEKWRVGARGNKLTQDFVMVTWFCFLRWRKMRAYMDQLAPTGPSPLGPPTPPTHSFRGQGLPFPPTPVLTLAGKVI